MDDLVSIHEIPSQRLYLSTDAGNSKYQQNIIDWLESEGHSSPRRYTSSRFFKNVTQKMGVLYDYQLEPLFAYHIVPPF